MKNLHPCPLIIASLALLLAGCETRSISNSGYVSANPVYPFDVSDQPNRAFRGELSELDVLGVSPSKTISEADIHAALNDGAKVSLKRGDRLLLVQSGAQYPDDAMIQELKPYFELMPISGVPASPPARGTTMPAINQPLDMTLRLAAARAGAKTLLIYWGILESSAQANVGKSLSWVPIVGMVVPDESQDMRIRLKAAVIDVDSGHWEMLIPDAVENSALSAAVSRRHNDQEQVNLLKAEGYKRLVADLAKRLN